MVVKDINLSKEERNKKPQYGPERYGTFPEDEKQSLVEYRKKINKIWKDKTSSQITIY